MLICYTDLPTLYELPVHFASLVEQTGERYLVLNRDDLSLYALGQKVISAKECYTSLLQERHQSTLDVIKRKGKLPSSIIDGTGGWGRDAITFAQAGIIVDLYEQHEELIVFISYALQRWFPMLKDKIRLHHQCFSKHTLKSVECVYLDPMFFGDKKSRSKKTMHTLYELYPSNQKEQLDLLKKALLSLHTETLIIKQPKHAASMIKDIMKHERFNRTCRFDVYYLNGQALTLDQFN